MRGGRCVGCASLLLYCRRIFCSSKSSSVRTQTIFDESQQQHNGSKHPRGRTSRAAGRPSAPRRGRRRTPRTPRRCSTARRRRCGSGPGPPPRRSCRRCCTARCSCRGRCGRCHRLGCCQRAARRLHRAARRRRRSRAQTTRARCPSPRTVLLSEVVARRRPASSGRRAARGRPARSRTTPPFFLRRCGCNAAQRGAAQRRCVREGASCALLRCCEPRAAPSQQEVALQR